MLDLFDGSASRLGEIGRSDWRDGVTALVNVMDEAFNVDHEDEHRREFFVMRKRSKMKENKSTRSEEQT